MIPIFYHKCLTTPPDGDDMLRAAIVQIENLPYVYHMRMFWKDFNQMRDWWPVLIPLFLWLGWRTYHRDRVAFKAQRVLRQAQEAAAAQLEQDQSPDQPEPYNDPTPS